jgi:hypothetical protein
MKLASTLTMIVAFGIGTVVFTACGSSDTGSSSQPASSTCGNGVIDGTETCDGTNFGGKTCASITVGVRPNGNPTCNACVISDTTCTANAGSGGGTGTGGAPSFGGSTSGGRGGSSGGRPGLDAGIGP